MNLQCCRAVRFPHSWFSKKFLICSFVCHLFCQICPKKVLQMISWSVEKKILELIVRDSKKFIYSLNKFKWNELKLLMKHKRSRKGHNFRQRQSVLGKTLHTWPNIGIEARHFLDSYPDFGFLTIPRFNNNCWSIMLTSVWLSYSHFLFTPFNLH